MKNCAEFIARKGVDVDKVFSDQWTINQAEDAYKAFDSQSSGKGVFVF